MQRDQSIILTTLKQPSGCKSSHSSMQETSDQYAGVIARLCTRHRVIVCRDSIQWIVQRRKKGGADRSWRALGYFLNRDALIRFCATLNARVDPSAMAAVAALPEIFGGSQ